MPRAESTRLFPSILAVTKEVWLFITRNPAMAAPDPAVNFVFTATVAAPPLAKVKLPAGLTVPGAPAWL